MEINFYKYQGTGNDFIMIDDRRNNFPSDNPSLVQLLCDRKFGIGADGLILLQNSKDADFKMQYFNADGNESSMCGNGGRCIVSFAKKLGIINNSCSFMAIDGFHNANINNELVELEMSDVNDISEDGNDWILNTGSPHYVKYVDNIDRIDVYSLGKKIRYNETYKQEGINVNFIQWENNSLHVCTYERGVEDETLSCGTGVTAAALVHARNNEGINKIDIKTKGGSLIVKFKKNNFGKYTDIWLCGPATYVFSGVFNV